MAIAPPPPADWPAKADKDYDRIRVLGAGAFGEVWLAKSKAPGENGKCISVAIKGVSIQNENEGATAAREIAILSELNHPNIIKLLHDYAPASPAARGRYMALSYVNGPDIGQLLEVRGALSISVARQVARDLISAVAYCHARGVMHRDIKPDNIMLEGACREGKKWIDDDLLWEEDGKAKLGLKAVLVDFGFARATSADDYEQEENNRKAANKRAMIERHKSRIVFRAKSAVGTRHFAAPEIVGTVRRRETNDFEKALTECVSSYALISDAYAVGATLSEVATGVPPGSDVDVYVKANRTKAPKKQNSLAKLKKKLSRRFSAGSNHATYDINLRYMHELPAQAKDLITCLMKEDMVRCCASKLPLLANTATHLEATAHSKDDRLSVREAQDHEWIGGYESLRHGDVPSRATDPIVYIRNESALR